MFKVSLRTYWHVPHKRHNMPTISKWWIFNVIDENWKEEISFIGMRILNV
jgi:hypothetical protein